MPEARSDVYNYSILARVSSVLPPVSLLIVRTVMVESSLVVIILSPVTQQSILILHITQHILTYIDLYDISIHNIVL